MKQTLRTDERLMNAVSIALRHPISERESYVREACEGDPDLCAEAIRVLKSRERMGDFLLEPVGQFEESPRFFQVGQVIEGRFELLREIGEGGMGVVYEALDQKRKIKIAIKSPKPGFQRLLSPELEGAIKVSHWNICRVHEIHTAPTKHGDVDFLTMELLEGETLSAFLKRLGKPTEPEALEIAEQLCDGLAEAHRCGVVHRDLKSSNIVLCRSGDGSLRVVTTDFGLAAIGPISGELAGTPVYMAPEIWAGEPASRASDIYALGVILFQLVGDPDTTRIEEILGSPRNRPQLSEYLAKTVPPRWATVVSQCLRSSPVQRPADASEVLEHLLERRRYWRVIVPIMVLLVCGFFSPHVRSAVHKLIWPPLSGVKLVVLPPFVADESGLSSEVPAGVLADVGDRIAHLRNSVRAVSVVSEKDAENLRVHTAEQARSVLHGTHALLTRVGRNGAEWIVNNSVIDLSHLRPIHDFSGHYSEANIGTLPEWLAKEVASSLQLDAGALESLSSAATSSYERALYLVGLPGDHQDEAIQKLLDASRLDPNSVLPWSQLVEQEIAKYSETKDLQYLDQAQEHLQVARKLNPDSARIHLAAGRIYEANSQYELALENYNRAASLERYNSEGFVRAAGAYDKLSLPTKAMEMYNHAIELNPTDYEPYQGLGIFHYVRGNFSEAAKQFALAIERDPAAYNAYTFLAAALDSLGRDPEAYQALMKSLQIHKTPRALNSMGAVLVSEGRDADALPYFTNAIGMNPLVDTYWLNLGDCNRRLGHVTNARKDYQKAMSLVLAELAQNPRDAEKRSLVAYFSARLRDRRRSEQEIQQALQLSPGDAKVLRRAVLTYVALNLPDQAIGILRSATPETLRDLDSHPDLADFRKDPRFKTLIAEFSSGGK